MPTPTTPPSASQSSLLEVPLPSSPQPTGSPLTPLERAELLAKAARGELTPDDTRRVILATRASFLARDSAPAAKPRKAVSEPKPDVPKQFDVDFF